MAIVKADFYKHELNQFLPNRVRGEYLDWGLNAMVMEVQIDATETGTLYAGDPVKIASTSKGKLKVVAAGADAAFGYILFNPKHETAKAGDTVTIAAVADSGYTFDAWDTTDVTLADEATTSFTMPAKRVTIEATFTA